MVEPLSIVGATASIIGIIDVVARAVVTLHSLYALWKESDLFLLQFTSQLIALNNALTKIKEWMNDVHDETHYLLDIDLGMILHCCQSLASKLEAALDDLQSTNTPQTMATKAKIMLSNGVLEQISRMIERQTGALVLLLTACNTKMLADQQRLLKVPETRKIFEQVREDSASLIVHRDSMSLRSSITDNLSKLSMVFDFDTELLSTRAYVPTVRKTLKRSIQFGLPRRQIPRTLAIGKVRDLRNVDHPVVPELPESSKPPKPSVSPWWPDWPASPLSNSMEVMITTQISVTEFRWEEAETESLPGFHVTSPLREESENESPPANESNPGNGFLVKALDGETMPIPNLHLTLDNWTNEPTVPILGELLLWVTIEYSVG
jgi:hypothetical protein